MGYVTNIIIATDIEESGMNVLNRMMESRKEGNRFNEVSEGCGGTKHLFDGEIWCGAFNDFDFGEFLEFMRVIEWSNRPAISVWVKMSGTDTAFSRTDPFRVLA